MHNQAVRAVAYLFIGSIFAPNGYLCEIRPIFFFFPPQTFSNLVPEGAMAGRANTPLTQLVRINVVHCHWIKTL